MPAKTPQTVAKQISATTKEFHKLVDAITNINSSTVHIMGAVSSMKIKKAAEQLAKCASLMPKLNDVQGKCANNGDEKTYEKAREKTQASGEAVLKAVQSVVKGKAALDLHWTNFEKAFKALQAAQKDFPKKLS